MTCIGGLLNTVTGSVILTADEVKEVEGHIDQLNAENARLRSCLSDDAENAKLREFAACMAMMTDVVDRNPNDLLTEYGTATTAYLLMAMSIDSLERKNRRLEDENAKLWELVARMAEALGIDCEWADPNWCKSPCVLEFECWPESDHTELRCPAWAIMHELGIEATA